MFTLQAGFGNKKIMKQIDNITKNVEKGIRKAHYFIGKDLVKYTRDKMKEEKHGNTYESKEYTKKVKYGMTKGVYVNVKTTSFYRASAPGEVPLSKKPFTTGDLSKSLNFLVRGWQQLEFGANTPYAKALELGTPKMEPRPYLKPAIINNFRNAENYFGTQIKLSIEQDNA
jgi:HK97 gp10 family phage protein